MYVIAGCVVALLAGVAMLVGWGMADVKGFVEEPSRVVGLVVASVGSGLALRGVRFRVEMKSEARGQEWLAILTMGMFGVGLWLLPFLDARPNVADFLTVEGDALRWGGVLVFGVGEAVMVWSIWTLGLWFTPRIGVQRGQELINSGPYRVVRHPFYSGLLASMLGFPAIFGSWVGVIVAVIAVPLVLYRVGVEEEHLEREFEEEYRSMKQRTWRLVPYVW
jgi:protein-S-isoprenylcysteine O-methyltransferase Ste14